MLGRNTISVSDASRRLGVSTSTVRNWIRQGRLQAEAGSQPVRPRWSVVTDESGQPLGADGRPFDTGTTTPDGSDRIASIEHRLSAIEAALGIDAPTPERFRDAALQLNAAMEHQRRAFQLQLEATRVLDDAVAEQAAIIAGLLIGDPPANFSEDAAGGRSSVVEH